jgi:hypothetical protein
MDKLLSRLLILLLALLLIGCAQQALEEPRPTFPPPPDTPTASPMPTATPATQSNEAVVDEETAEEPVPTTSSPTQTPDATVAPVEVTATPIPQTVEPVDPEEALTAAVLQNMTFSNPVVPGGKVTLENGIYEAEAAPGSASQIQVTMSDNLVFGEIDGKYYASVILISDGGGSGTFYTLHLVGLENGEAQEAASILLGDRIELHDLAIADDRIEVELTRAGPNDPLCCPTERVEQVYALRDDALVLVDENGTAPPPTASGSTADLVDRGLILDVTGVASLYAWTIERASPQADPPLPAHLLMTFDGHEAVDMQTELAPTLIIFPIEPYLGLAGRADDDGQSVEKQITRLWQLVETGYEDNDPLPGWMPLLPPTETPVEDWSDFVLLDSVRGRGLRYLRVVEGELAYTYQGITEDGRYYISFTWPLSSADGPDAEALDAMIASLALGEAPVEPQARFLAPEAVQSVLFIQPAHGSTVFKRMLEGQINSPGGRYQAQQTVIRYQ